MMSSMLMIVLALIALHVQKGGGWATIEPLRTELDHGRLIHYCLRGTMKLTLNSSFSDLETCMHYECDSHGLHSYPVGRPSMLLPASPDTLAECKLILVACDPMWVMKSNEMIYCPQHLVPQGGMVGK